MIFPHLTTLGLALFLAAPSAAQTYSWDDGGTEAATAPLNVAETCFLHGFDADAGENLVAISVAIGFSFDPPGGLDGRLMRVCVWDDPNADGDPADAVLLYESNSFPATLTNSDTKVPFALPNQVPVTDRFFVGAIIETQPGDLPVGLDLTGFSQGTDAFFLGDSTAVNAANLGSASFAPRRSIDAVYLLDAIGDGLDTIGANYCGSPANSSGLPGEIHAIGSDLVVDNELTLIATQLPPQQFGIFATSTTQGFVVMPNGQSNGNFCLAGQTGRFRGPGQILTSGVSGRFELAVDLNAVPQGMGTVAVLAGESRNFQAWYRDGVGLGSNFTNGIEITFR